MSSQENKGGKQNIPPSAAMFEMPQPHTSKKSQRRLFGHAALLRVSTLSVAGVICALLVTAVVPPIVADETDRAVIDAPITLLTAPIAGEIDAISATPGKPVKRDEVLARLSNRHLDQGTLVSLKEKASSLKGKLESTGQKEQSDRDYLESLDGEIAHQIAQQKVLLGAEVTELRAKVAESQAVSGVSKAVVDRQNKMIARDTASPEMVRPTAQQYSASMHNLDAAKAKLDQKVSQLDALDKGIYVGDELVALGQLTQKRRDIALDAKRMAIEEKEISSLLEAQQKLVDSESHRLDMLSAATVAVPSEGTVVAVSTTVGRHVNAGDSLASLVNCGKRFVVAIFSYRQAQKLSVGTPVAISGGDFSAGTVTALLPKISDKADEGYAVPFPQTERRELYAIIKPGNVTDAEQDAQPDSSSCHVGKWVTVRRDDGIIPSMSVTWRKVGNLVSYLSPRSNSMQAEQMNERKIGVARLIERFKNDRGEAYVEWAGSEDQWFRPRSNLAFR